MVKEKLVKMVGEAPEEVLAWMRPSGFGGHHAVFFNHHILIAGRKGKICDLENRYQNLEENK
jgi:hypothetical protein